MFYSHTILARKGPLGTVWCAAHLQHRLKKSHYAATDIPSTVDRIMFPEVPIALRMSGHLLLGVVRIYSKKVEYLHQDCNVVLNGLKKAFASIDLSLPENAMQAPLQSITLPETLCLDALDCGPDFDYDGAHNDHLGNQEDITLTEQFPIATNPYVAITFDEDIRMEDLSHQMEDFGSHVTPMDVDTIPPHPEQGTHSPVNLTDERTTHNDEVNLQGSQGISGVPSPTDEQRRPSDDFTLPDCPEKETQKDFGCQDPGPSQPTEILNLSHRDYSSPENVPEIEAQRNAVSDISSETFPFSSSHRNDVTEQHDPPTNEKAILSPIMEGSIHSVGPSPAVQPSSETPASVASLSEGRQHINTSVSVAIQSTPRIEQPPLEQPLIEQPRPRKRKKQYFDDPVVLSNKFIGKRLKDASDIIRKRKKLPSSALGIWKLKNVLRKEQVFLQPSLTRLCSDLSNIYDKTYISTKSHLFEEALPDPRPTSPSPTTEVVSEDGAVVSPLPPFSPLTIDVSLEHRVGDSVPANESSPVKGLQSPSSPATGSGQDAEQFRGVEHDGVLPDSPTIKHSLMIDDFTPAPSPKVGSASVHSLEINTGTQILQTPDLQVSAGSEFGTLTMLGEGGVHPDYTGPSHNPESMTAEAEDLWFLEADDRTPAGSQGTEGVDSLSVRTRAVAQYLKSQSPEDLSSDLSLNKILEGKRRKLCARMFFETLVLKSYDLIDVKQEVPYGDISLKLTQTLSKAQI
ncbi:putative rad21/Rec8-like protein [Rosa chinensis]|uniref:Putative rad21/Rec8-like protein n=1 Tax=Rosa chinensis TaxID=74649 RepID=A0A2P6S758_ROSCH|nr:sister chromatid cohesion 1 protein 3 [Rosa chinensis]XP_024173024.1 sister chromatid cohesion 1 protein 3 [Rosa chinensis]PRQ54495.1 putative rad21/Rec8-like protein [Rosa chinensis]